MVIHIAITHRGTKQAFEVHLDAFSNVDSAKVLRRVGQSVLKWIGYVEALAEEGVDVGAPGFSAIGYIYALYETDPERHRELMLRSSAKIRELRNADPDTVLELEEPLKTAFISTEFVL